MQMEERLCHLVARTLKVNAEEVPPDAGIQRYPGWDSMAHVSIMLEVEKEFGVEVNEDLMNCRTIKELATYLSSRA